MEFFEWISQASYEDMLTWADHDTFRCEVCGITRMVRTTAMGYPATQFFPYRHHKDCPVLLGDRLQMTARWS